MKEENMGSKRKIYTFAPVLILVIILIIFMCFFLFDQENYIIINNKTNISLSGLSIKYIYSDKEKVTELPKILPHNHYKMKFSFPDDFTEGSIQLNYIDKQGILREEYLIGYIERAYHSILVIINSVD
jgi:hypothetical protein